MLNFKVLVLYHIVLIMLVLNYIVNYVNHIYNGFKYTSRDASLCYLNKKGTLNYN